MSYTTSRARALDATRPLAHRASHARSCAMLVSEALGVTRDQILERVKSALGVDMLAPASESAIEQSIAWLDAARTAAR